MHVVNGKHKLLKEPSCIIFVQPMTVVDKPAQHAFGARKGLVQRYDHSLR